MAVDIRGAARAPLLWSLIASVIVWAYGANEYSPHQLIEIANSIIIDIGVGVTAAFTPAGLRALIERKPSRSDILAFGIWLVWLSIPAERMLSWFGRYYRKDISFFDTHFHTLILSVTALSGLCHLFAPDAIDGRLPPRAWLRLGILVALACLALSFTILHNGFK